MFCFSYSSPQLPRTQSLSLSPSLSLSNSSHLCSRILSFFIRFSLSLCSFLRENRLAFLSLFSGSVLAFRAFAVSVRESTANATVANIFQPVAILANKQSPTDRAESENIRKKYIEKYYNKYTYSVNKSGKCAIIMGARQGPLYKR